MAAEICLSQLSSLIEDPTAEFQVGVIQAVLVDQRVILFYF